MSLNLKLTGRETSQHREIISRASDQTLSWSRTKMVNWYVPSLTRTSRFTYPAPPTPACITSLSFNIPASISFQSCIQYPHLITRYLTLEVRNQILLVSRVGNGTLLPEVEKVRNIVPELSTKYLLVFFLNIRWRCASPVYSCFYLNIITSYIFKLYNPAFGDMVTLDPPVFWKEVFIYYLV